MRLNNQQGLLATYWPRRKLRRENIETDEAESRRKTKPPIFLKYRSSSIFILLTVSIAVFTDIFLYAVIVPVIPFALSVRVGVASENVQHYVSVLLGVYGGALLGSSPICGWFADKSPSRRLPLLIGLLALAGSTLLLCLGKTIALLILARLLQGISAAIVWTVGLALLADTVGPEKIGQSVGYVSMSMSLAILVAPLLGGVVYDKLGYYPVYYMAFGMIILDIILRVLLIEKKVALMWLPMPEPAVTHPPLTTVEKPEKSKNITPTEDVAAITSNPTIPATPPSSSLRSPAREHALLHRYHRLRQSSATLMLITDPGLLASLFATLVQSLLLTCWDAVLPLHVASLFGWSSIGAGLIFLPLIVPSFISPLIGYWADKRGARAPVVLGFLLAVPGVVCLRYVDFEYLSANAPGGEKEKGGLSKKGMVILLCALLAFTGLAIDMAMVPLLAEITYVCEKLLPSSSSSPTSPPSTSIPSIPPTASPYTSRSQKKRTRSSYATAYGIFNAAFAGGMLAGPLWGGFVVTHAGWGTMCWSLGIMSVGGAIVSALGVGEGWSHDRAAAVKSGNPEGDALPEKVEGTPGDEDVEKGIGVTADRKEKEQEEVQKEDDTKNAKTLKKEDQAGEDDIAPLHPLPLR